MNNQNKVIWSTSFPLIFYFYCSPGREEKSVLFSYLLWNLCIEAANKNSNESEIIDERVENWQLTFIMRTLPSKTMPVKWSWLSALKSRWKEQEACQVIVFFLSRSPKLDGPAECLKRKYEGCGGGWTKEYEALNRNMNPEKSEGSDRWAKSRTQTCFYLENPPC